MRAYSLDDCIEACGSAGLDSTNNTFCTQVQFFSQIASNYGNGQGAFANCYLKNNDAVANPDAGDAGSTQRLNLAAMAKQIKGLSAKKAI